MTYQDLFQKWGLTTVQLDLKFASFEFKPESDDREAAWEMYVELLTRITTQPLDPNAGDEETALTSVYSLFKTTRKLLKKKGRNASAFTRVSIIVLNQIVRPFTAKWHRKKLEHAFEKEEDCAVFRKELEVIQKWLIAYTRLLADMAQVEDLTGIDYLAE